MTQPFDPFADQSKFDPFADKEDKVDYFGESEQFKEDLKANEDASDALDKELNRPFITGNKGGESVYVPPGLSGAKVNPKTITKELSNNHKLAMVILAEHGGLESNVPLNSPYWQLKQPDANA